MSELDRYRREIDEVDEKIVELYERRMKLVEGVADYKIKSGREVFDPKREQEKLNHLEGMASDSFNASGIRELFQQIMAISRKRQYQLLTENGISLPVDYSTMDHLYFKNARVVFQGVEGAYSFAAMKSFFDESIESIHVKTWREAMQMVADGDADFGVLPIENTTAGAVSDIYDLLLQFENYIVGEQVLKIDHTLMALPGTSLSDIDTVYSHPQGLKQCAKWLDENHPEWKRVNVLNTAMAAEKVARDGLKNQAAIASRTAAEYFGLEVLAGRGLSEEQNQTRFIIISRQRRFVRSAQKISICFGVPHRSGSLYNILAHFIFNGLNMFKIESRPIPDRPFEYRFFIDFEGNLGDDSVKNALRGIQAEAADMKLLGNY